MAVLSGPDHLIAQTAKYQEIVAASIARRAAEPLAAWWC